MVGTESTYVRLLHPPAAAPVPTPGHLSAVLALSVFQSMCTNSAFDTLLSPVRLYKMLRSNVLLRLRHKK